MPLRFDIQAYISRGGNISGDIDFYVLDHVTDTGVQVKANKALPPPPPVAIPLVRKVDPEAPVDVDRLLSDSHISTIALASVEAAMAEFCLPRGLQAAFMSWVYLRAENIMSNFRALPQDHENAVKVVEGLVDTWIDTFVPAAK